MLQQIKKLKNPVKALKAEGADFHVEIDKSLNGERILVSGVKRISELSDKLLSLRCRTYELKIIGYGISLLLYEDKSVEISGKLEVVEFVRRKD